MPWLEISALVNSQNAEKLSCALTDNGALSVTLQDAADCPVYEPDPGETVIWKETKVTGLFDENANLSELCKKLQQEFKTTPTLSILKDQIWERTWLDHFQPMQFGENFWVCPSDQTISNANATVLSLDPGLAFGTGTHPTTALCLKWLAKQALHDKTIIDYGCGSGILAITALLLGAKSAIAIDIDPQALIATHDNAEKNKVLNRLDCFLPEQFTAQSADIVLANILAQPLIKLSGQITELVQPGGKLVLSGILKEQVTDVTTAYRNDFELTPIEFIDEWARISGIRHVH